MIVHGTKNVDLFECTNPQLNKWRVRWNVQPDNDQNNEKINEDLVIYNEVEFAYKPSIEEIKDLIDNGVIVPVECRGHIYIFQEESIQLVKTARRLRDDFQLDQYLR